MPNEFMTVQERLAAEWRLQQKDGCGSLYYFYPDGVFVHQNPRRREFVITGSWKLEGKTLVIFNQSVLHTNFDAEQLESIRQTETKMKILRLSDNAMKWSDSSNRARVLQKLGPLPDRTENPYWNLGTEEDYRRGIRKEFGMPM